jgi:hypothetical protein
MHENFASPGSSAHDDDTTSQRNAKAPVVYRGAPVIGRIGARQCNV